MRKYYVASAILGLGLLLSFPKSTARADFGFPVVFNATVDTNANILTLTGVNFGASPTVTLGNSQQLSVQSSNSGQIIANLPANLAPGSYLLTVKFSNPTFTVFEVTIGAVGPPGPSGSGGGGDQLFQAKVVGSQTLSQSFSAAPIANLSVPAGSYLILGKTSLQNGDATADSAGCSLTLVVGGTSPLDSTSTSVVPQGFASVSLQISETFSGPTTIYLQCVETQAAVPGGVSASNTVLSALSVGAIN